MGLDDPHVRDLGRLQGFQKLGECLGTAEKWLGVAVFPRTRAAHYSARRAESHLPRAATWNRTRTSQMRTAFSSKALKTGSSAPGELEMTFSTSAVAVCCSSVSRNSWSNRVFSIAMTACAAKFCHQFNRLVGKATCFLPADTAIDPISSSFFIDGASRSAFAPPNLASIGAEFGSSDMSGICTTFLVCSSRSRLCPGVGRIRGSRRRASVSAGSSP